MPRLTISANVGDVAPPPVTLTYTAASGADEIPLTGAMTYTVDLAMLPSAGCQALRISVEEKDASGIAATAPVRATLTPGGYVDIPPKGFLVLAAPGTAGGVTGLTLTSTANALVKVGAYG